MSLAETTNNRVLRFLGNCQICEADQKLHKELMVHHGYKRPGHGTIVGDCPGVGEPPYERSCEALKAYRENTKSLLASHQTYLDSIKTGELKKFQLWRGNKMVNFERGVTEDLKWRHGLERLRQSVEVYIRQDTHEISRCTRRIDAWKLLPIRTVEEERAKQEAEKNARWAEKQQKRDAFMALQEARRVKREALQAERQVIRDAFATQFRELAASPKRADTHSAALAILDELKRPKNNFILPRDLECDEALIALGLAEIADNIRVGYVRYKF